VELYPWCGIELSTGMDLPLRALAGIKNVNSDYEKFFDQENVNQNFAVISNAYMGNIQVSRLNLIR
jgi:hypothetical protein